MKLYKIKANWCYGDDKEVERQKQLDALASVGLSGKEIDSSVIGTADQVLGLIKAGYPAKYEVEKSIELVYENQLDSEQTVANCLEKTLGMVEQLFNEKCSSEQPGNLLMQVDETLLLEDACTDALQERLSQGFRILAVCPQPQRRPDYVLGRKIVPTRTLRS